MIFILTEANDEPTSRVIDVLRKCNTSVLRVNLDENYLGFSFNLDMLNQTGINIYYDGVERKIDSKDVFWFRRGNFGSYLFINDDKNLSFIDFIAEEKKALEVFLSKVILKRHYCIGNPNIHNIGKLEVLLAAKSVALRIPKSYVTYKKSVLIETGINKFVCKPFSDVLFMDSENSLYHTFIEEYEVSKLKNYFGNSFFQEAVDFDQEIRLLCVERKIFAVKYSHKIRGHVDSRHQSNSGEFYERTKLSEEVQQSIFNLCKLLQTNFAVIDLLVDKSGLLWFIDFNPCGQYDEIYEHCYPEIDEYIANLLYEKELNQ
ncbi:MAG: hypothetical protein M0Q90_04225 [Bacteroidales bacterium]|nr:hypothetical protein [Bacteroidales bacterium]